MKFDTEPGNTCPRLVMELYPLEMKAIKDLAVDYHEPCDDDDHAGRIQINCVFDSSEIGTLATIIQQLCVNARKAIRHAEQVEKEIEGKK